MLRVECWHHEESRAVERIIGSIVESAVRVCHQRFNQRQLNDSALEVKSVSSCNILFVHLISKIDN